MIEQQYRHILLDASRGVYLYRDLANDLNLDSIRARTYGELIEIEELIAALQNGPVYEFYYDDYTRLESILVLEEAGIFYGIEQDGDIFTYELEDQAYNYVR